MSLAIISSSLEWLPPRKMPSLRLSELQAQRAGRAYTLSAASAAVPLPSRRCLARQLLPTPCS